MQMEILLCLQGLMNIIHQFPNLERASDCKRVRQNGQWSDLSPFPTLNARVIQICLIFFYTSLKSRNPGMSGFSFLHGCIVPFLCLDPDDSSDIVNEYF